MTVGCKAVQVAKAKQRHFRTSSSSRIQIASTISNTFTLESTGQVHSCLQATVAWRV